MESLEKLCVSCKKARVGVEKFCNECGGRLVVEGQDKIDQKLLPKLYSVLRDDMDPNKSGKVEKS